MSDKSHPEHTLPGLPKRIRERLAASARDDVAHLSDTQLENWLGDQIEDLADQLARQEQVAFPYAVRALNKALRQARGDRLGLRASRSGTRPNFSMVLDDELLCYVDHHAARYGSRAAVVKAALTLLRRTDP